MDRGAWRAIDCGVAKSQECLSTNTSLPYCPLLVPSFLIPENVPTLVNDLDRGKINNNNNYIY